MELTNIEKKFLEAICSDKSYSKIAAELHRSESGLSGIYERVRDKLNIKGRYGLMMYAIKNKIVKI